MIFLHIDSTTNNIDLFHKYAKQNKHMFVLFYMEGCGPCNATRPEWEKIKNIFSKNTNDNIVIVDVDQEMIHHINKKYVTEPIAGFPTMRYIYENNNKKITSENYENSNINLKNRTIDSFVEWINLKSKKNIIGGKNKRKLTKRKLTKRKLNKNKTNNRKLNKNKTNNRKL
jgi:hypothetical protein